MPEGHTRLQALLVVRLAKPSRVGELKTDDQIVGSSVTFPVRLNQNLPNPGQILFVPTGDDELVRIGAAIRAHGHRLTAKNEFRAALPEALPAAADFVGDAASGRAVPAFHRLNRPAIANALAVDEDAGQRLRQRRFRPADDGILTRQVKAERRDVLAEILHRLERWNARELEWFGHKS